jgi:hypothetical protein
MSDVQIECFTAPGTGKNLSWKLSVDGQNSTVLLANTAYGVPVITGFDGQAADSADTSGGQLITILGQNFGPIGSSRLGSVYYSQASETLVRFIAENCSVIEAHTKIR